MKLKRNNSRQSINEGGLSRIEINDFEEMFNFIENDRDKFFMLAITKMSYKNFDIMNMMAITTTGKSLI